MQSRPGSLFHWDASSRGCIQSHESKWLAIIRARLTLVQGCADARVGSQADIFRQTTLALPLKAAKGQSGQVVACYDCPRHAPKQNETIGCQDGRRPSHGSAHLKTSVLVLERHARDADQSFRLPAVSESLPKKSQRSLQSSNDPASAPLSERRKRLLAAW